LGCSSISCRRRSARRCSRCPSPAPSRSPSGPGCWARWPRDPAELAEHLGLQAAGTALCVLDLYDRQDGKKPDSGSILGLFFHLTSGADTYTVEQISAWLAASGFGKAEKTTFRTLPSLAMVTAKAV
jgi:hypothetical protein